MKALAAVALLVLLLCRQPGRGQAQDDQDNKNKEEDEEEQEDEDEDEEDEEDEKEEEAGMMAGGRGRGLQCHFCQALQQKERCNQTRSCLPSQSFCKTIIYEWDTESGPLTTYSVWCADTCEPVTRTAEATLITMTCCQTNLCNIPPWQGRPGGGPGGPRGSPETVATTLLLSLLPGLGVMGS